MSRTITGVAVTSTRTPRLKRLTVEHGTTFAYERHIDNAQGVAILVACLCPDGHGVADLPERFWISMDEATMDLIDVISPDKPEPITLTEIALLPTPDDLVGEATATVSLLARIGTRVPAYRPAGAAA